MGTQYFKVAEHKDVPRPGRLLDWPIRDKTSARNGQSRKKCQTLASDGQEDNGSSGGSLMCQCMSQASEGQEGKNRIGLCSLLFRVRQARTILVRRVSRNHLPADRLGVWKIRHGQHLRPTNTALDEQAAPAGHDQSGRGV